MHSVLDPNKAVREGFGAVTVLTDEGKVYTGILRAETPEAVTILDATTREVRAIPTEVIEEKVAAP